MNRRARLVSRLAFAVGVGLFIGALWNVDYRSLASQASTFGPVVPTLILVSGSWHLARTWAWAICFAGPLPVSFAHLARVRLAAEAFSYVTVRGVAGEPLKVAMLAGQVDSRLAAAAVALERLSYLVVTTGIVGVCAVAATFALPLTRIWVSTFYGFGIAAAAVVTVALIVVRGRGAYANAMLDRVAAASDGRLGGGRVARFILLTERQLLALARGDSQRLTKLILADLICFGSMTLEVWIIARAVGVDLTTSAAAAVETFTRVASTATAFVPLGIGTLEASNIVAMAAVGAVSVGVPLALVRRLRGLFWAGVGFVVYPKLMAAQASDTSHQSDAQPTGSKREAETTGRPPTDVLIYVADDPRVPVTPFHRLAALPIGERVLRAANKAGYGRILVWAPASHERFTRLAARLRTGALVTIAADEAAWNTTYNEIRGRAANVTVIGPGTVVAPALLDAARHAGVADAGLPIDVPAGEKFPESGVLRVHAEDAVSPARLSDWLNQRWRSAVARPDGRTASAQQAMLALRIADGRQDLARAEAEIRRSVYKATDPYLARLNRRMSLPISMWLLRTPLTANQLSMLLVALGFGAGWLFSLGTYATGIAAAALSLAASILDGSDGEIARLKYQESSFGCWVETIGDYTYYVAVLIGLTIGSVRYTAAPVFYRVGASALAGALITFALLIFLRQRITNGQPEKLQSTAKAHFYASKQKWAWLVAKLSFCATRSTMPYGIMVFGLLGILPGILVLAAIGANVYWISLMIRLRQMLAQVREKKRAVEHSDGAEGFSPLVP
jgi:phosphatidylglycerophosphate synthase